MPSTTRPHWSSLIVLLIVSLPSVCLGQYDRIQWASGVEEAKIRAKAENKTVLLHFGATWCAPCRQLESFVFPVPAIATAMNHSFVPVKLDVDQHKELAEQYGVSKIPQDVFLGPDGEVLFRRVSPKGSQNYGLMLGTAAKIALRTTRESQMAAEAIASITQKKEDTENRSVFPDQRAAQAGNARSAFDQTPRPGNTGVLPAALVAKSDAMAGEQLQQSVDGLTKRLETKAPEATFQQARFEQSRVPAIENQFAGQMSASIPDLQNRQADSQAMANGTASRSAPNRSAEVRSPYVPENPTNIGESGNTISSQGLTNNRSLDGAVSAAQRATTIAATDPQPTRGTNQQVSASENVSSSPTLGLDGYCPVSLLQEQRWVKGNATIGRVHRGKIYLFADEAKANRFFESPDQWSPALAGYDPVVYQREGQLVEGLRKFGVFCDTPTGQTIVLFANQENRDTFKAERGPFLEKIRVATEVADRR